MIIPYLEHPPEELGANSPIPDLWPDVQVLDDGHGIIRGAAATVARPLVQRVEEEGIAQELAVGRVLGHVALEVGVVGVQQRVEVDAATLVDPQPGQRQRRIVVVVRVGEQVAALFRVEGLHRESG